MADTGPILRTRGLEKVYRLGKTAVPAVCGIDLDVPEGQFLAIMGPSGCGKSTLLYMLGGLATPTAGRVVIDGTDIGELSDPQRTALRRDHIGYVFQRFNLFSTLTAHGNVRLAQEIAGTARGDDADARALMLLDWVGLASKVDRKPMELSIGEQQRVAIARALVNRPKILLADEPTGNLDTQNAEQIMRVFNSLNKDHNQTILMITHNPEVAGYADRIIHMRDGKIVDPEEQ